MPTMRRNQDSGRCLCSRCERHLQSAPMPSPRLGLPQTPICTGSQPLAGQGTWYLWPLGTANLCPYLPPVTATPVPASPGAISQIQESIFSLPTTYMLNVSKTADCFKVQGLLLFRCGQANRSGDNRQEKMVCHPSSQQVGPWLPVEGVEGSRAKGGAGLGVDMSLDCSFHRKEQARLGEQDGRV